MKFQDTPHQLWEAEQVQQGVGRTPRQMDAIQNLQLLQHRTHHRMGHQKKPSQLDKTRLDIRGTRMPHDDTTVRSVGEGRRCA